MFDVSIIIPVYNAKYTIKKTLESINNQKFKNKIPKIELILSIVFIILSDVSRS